MTKRKWIFFNMRKKKQHKRHSINILKKDINTLNEENYFFFHTNSTSMMSIEKLYHGLKYIKIIL